MALLHSIASSLFSRHTARRLGRVIPNPALRFVAVTAATTLVPVLIEQGAKAWQARRRKRARAHRATT